jgi:hypothetical protein
MANHPSTIQLSDLERKRVERVRKVLVEMAELQEVPKRFEMIHQGGYVTVVDRETNSRSRFPLAHYEAIRKVMNDLFA